MKVFNQSGRRANQQLLIAGCLLALSILLAACGGTSATDTDFSVYVPNGLQPLGNVSGDVTNQLLDSTKTNIANQQLQVYSSDQSVADLEKAYLDEMVNKRHWTDTTAGVLGNQELAGAGTVQAFEKVEGGDANKKRVVGVVLLSPAVKDPKGLISKLRTDNGIDQNKQLILIVQGATGQPASPSAK